jgi:hypothetical protein
MKNMLRNPYVNTITVRDQDMFFGRTSLLRRIYAELISKQCISLIGPRHIGKSSLLHCLRLSELQGEFEQSLQKHIFVLIDLREYRHKTSEDFFETISRRILTQVRDRLELIHEPAVGGDEFSNLLSEIQEQGFHTVLLMDAFDNVTRNTNFDMEFFSFLRAQATFGKVSYVTATLAPLYEVCHSSIEESPFFNIFRTRKVEPLTLEEARELALQPSQRAGLPFTSEEVDWILKLAGRHPFFLQQVCHFLFEEKSIHDGAQVDRKRVKVLVYNELVPHFNDTWERLSKEQQEKLRDEAQVKDVQERELPELSESSLFRLFVREKFKIHLFHMTIEGLEKVLDKIDDIRTLGESDLRYMRCVSTRFKQSSLSTIEKGMVVREVLNEAFERLQGNGVRRDAAPEWRLYNILFYRYFKHHFKNDQISARLEFTSTRQYFRDRLKAIEALLTMLFEMEAAVLAKDEE